MATTKITRTKQDGRRTVIATETFTGAGETDWVMMAGNISVMLTGAGTAVSATLERSVHTDPVDEAPMGAAITGNPSTGINVANYEEVGVAWFRVKVSSLTGADVTVVMTGELA